MDTKSQFIANKKLAEWWGSIANDARFDHVLLHASGCALEGLPSAEQRDGVLKFKEILLTLSDSDAKPVSFASPGLHHNLEPKPRAIEVNTDKPATKKKQP